MKEYQVLTEHIYASSEILDKIKIKIKITLANGKGVPAEAVRNSDGRTWGIDLNLPIDWACPKSPQRSYKFWFNGFFFTDNLYFEYEENNNREDGRKILAYMLDWARQNPVYDKSAEWPWHDDATACRVLRWCVYYQKLKELCNTEEREHIEKSLAYQAELLFSDEFYTPRHNHGMHQDTGLIIYAIFYGKGEQQKDYIKKGLARTGEYLDCVYTPDGIHKEHSPFYARDVLMDTKLFMDIMQEISPDFSEHVRRYVDGGQEFFLHILQPDKAWPSLGDSSRNPLGDSVFRVNLPDNPKYKFLALKGAEGEPPSTDAVFPEGGYAIFRSAWEDGKKGTWMLFNAATHSSVHKHGDDLEVLLYHKGELFVEAGKRNFNYLDEKTSWAYLGYGHNVLLVNGKPYPVKFGNNGYQSIFPEALKTKITSWNVKDGVSSVTGYQCRFPGVEQERTLTYDRYAHKVKIEDAITAEETFQGTLLWHVAEGVTVKELPKQTGWEFFRGEEFIARAEIKANVPCNLEIIGKEGEYPYVPWIFNGKDDPVYGTLLKVNFEGIAGTSLIEMRVSFLEQEKTMKQSWENEVYWAQVYHDTICSSKWLMNKTISLGRMAVGYNFLYVLYRALEDFRPMHILELGLGQSTRLTSQYAAYFSAQHVVVEHDQEWTKFFLGRLRELAKGLQVCEVKLITKKDTDDQEYYAYDSEDFAGAIQCLGGKCDLILVDAPFGGKGLKARCDILPHLPGILAENFAILVDDCGRKGEQNTVREIKRILSKNNIEFASRLYQSDGEKHVCVIASRGWRFLASV